MRCATVSESQRAAAVYLLHSAERKAERRLLHLVFALVMALPWAMLYVLARVVWE